MPGGATSGATRRIPAALWLFAVASYAAAGATLASLALLAGFLSFLREVFAALILPFAVLVGMAGWSDRQGALTSLRGALATVTAPSPWLILPLVAGCLGLVAALQLRDPARRAAWLLPVAALPAALALHGGWFSLFLVPAALAGLCGSFGASAAPVGQRK